MMYLRDLEATAQQDISAIAHEVQEGAVGSLVDLEAARLAFPLGRAGHPAALVVHHKGVQLLMPLFGHRLLEVLCQAVYQILHPHSLASGTDAVTVFTALCGWQLKEKRCHAYRQNCAGPKLTCAA